MRLSLRVSIAVLALAALVSAAYELFFAYVAKKFNREFDLVAAPLWCLDTVGLATDCADRMIASRDGRVLEDGPTRSFDARALEQIYERSVGPAGGVAGG